MLLISDLIKNSERYDIFIKSWKLDNFYFLYKNKKLKNKKICVSLDLDNYDNFADFFVVLRDMFRCKNDISDITFFVNLRDNLFSRSEFENLKKFNKILKTQNTKLYFKEYEVLWEVEEVEKTYQYLNNIIEEISSKNLSSLEKFLYAYKKIAENVYSDDKTLKSPTMTHSLFSLQNNGHIVCRNYSTMLNEIINGLNDENLHCFSCGVNIFDNKDKRLGAHSINIVEIKDDKYSINGMYVSDCTWDSSKETDGPITLNYCLIPINDLKFYKNYSFTPSTNNSFQYFLEDDNSMCIYSYQNNVTLDVLKFQHVLDIDAKREEYKNYLLGKEPNLKKYLQTIPFSQDKVEYRFVKNLCNKIKHNSTVVPYPALLSAFTTSLIAQNVPNAREYAESVLNTSKIRSYHYFIYGAKNCVFNTAKKEFDRKNAIRQEMLELKRKHMEVQNKKIKNKLQQQKEENHTL